MVKLRRLNAERLEMPNLAMASEDTIAHYVMGTLTAIRVASVDQLTAKLIQRLPPDHRLLNFRSHIPTWLEEINNSASRAADNKQTTRPAHLLRNFGIYPKTTYETYRAALQLSVGKSKRNAQAANIQDKFDYITRHTLPIGDMIQTTKTSSRDSTRMRTRMEGSEGMLAALTGREHRTADEHETDRICAWIY
jgi:hypothetical protein